MDTNKISNIENAQLSEFSSKEYLKKYSKTDDNEVYDHFAHRNVAHPTSTIGSFFNLLKSSLGSGLLAMPAAFKHAGLVVGAIGTIVVGTIATHCVHILVKTSHAVCREARVPSLSYANTCECVFKRGPKRLRVCSRLVKNFVDCAMAGVCLGGTSVYVIFVASSLKDICAHVYPESNITLPLYCAILLLPLILITQLRHLKFLVPFSIFANVCLLVTFGITCYYTFDHIPDLSERKLFVSVSEWPLFVSTAIFAMEGINVVMPVENEMAHPEHFLGCPGILNVTMACVATLYGMVGIIGYLKYGDAVLGSITLNLPSNEIPALAAKVLVALAVFFTYCLQMYAPMEIIWNRLRRKVSNKYHNVAEIFARAFFVTLTVCLAAAIPDLELLISLVGAVFFSTLGLFVPIVVETVFKWERGLGACSWVLWKNLFLLLFYIVVLISGCYTPIIRIIEKLS